MTTSYVYLPKTQFNNQEIKWYDDYQSTTRKVQPLNIDLEDDAEQLVDKIEEWTWCAGIMDWHITEDFLKNGEREYYLQGLKMDYEDDVVVSSDMNDELIEDLTRVLNGFAVASIINIEIQDKHVIKIYFKDGSITIKGIGRT